VCSSDLQIYASNYQITYEKVHITGSRNSDGSAKPVDQVQLVATDTAITMSGLIGNTPWDDATDYNYTSNGAAKTAEVSVDLATASKGITSQIWYDPEDSNFDYQDIYGIQEDNEYYIKWDQGPGKVYAASCIGIYFTNQDFVDSGISSGAFDDHYHGVSNYHLWTFLDDDWSGMFYQSTMDSAPSVEYEFGMDISAAGAAVNVGILQDLELDDLEDGSWSSTNWVGTEGSDWDWVGTE